MSEKKLFATKIGLIAATVGSAIGLGNVWRFPAETQANGGAAFLLLYIVCVVALGVPVMLAEFALGRAGRSDAVGAFMKLSPGKPWWLVGALSVLVPFLIASYYMVVAGWTLEYLVESVTGGLYDGGAARNAFTARMEDYVCSTWQPLVYTLILIAMNIGVLLGGVQKGIERLSNIMMPIFFVILLAMLGVTLTLPGAGAGVRFFLEPDFSAIDASTVINALGQALFSLSVGMGILVTYASYYPDTTRLPRTAMTVSLLSVMVAVLMGLIIFPAVTSFGLEGESLRGATLVFVTLPEVFARLPLPQLWSSLFFVLLLLAALTSTVSICEVPVAMLQDRLRMSRRGAVLTVMGALTVCSALSSLSMGPLDSFRIAGLNIFNFLDTITTDIMLPTVAFFLCIFMGWFAPPGLLRNQLTNNGELRGRLTAAIVWAIRVFAPLAVLAIVLANYL